MIDPPLLTLRTREQLFGDERELPIVEVLRDGVVLGQLPATSAKYEMTPHAPGKLSVTVFVGDASVSGHE